MLVRIQSKPHSRKKLTYNLYALTYRDFFFYNLTKINHSLFSEVSLLKLLNLNYYVYTCSQISFFKNLAVRSHVVLLDRGDIGFNLDLKYVIKKPLDFKTPFLNLFYTNNIEVLVLHNLLFVNFFMQNQVCFYFKRISPQKFFINYSSSAFTAAKKIIKLRFLRKSSFFTRLFQFKPLAAQKKINFLKFNIFFKNINPNFYKFYQN